jgi:hypothetical protein
MKRPSKIVVLFYALSLGAVCVWKANELPRGFEGKGTLVFAIRDISVGALVTPDSVEERITPYCKMPDHAICKTDEVIGSKPIYGIEKGQILSQYDFLTQKQVAEDYRPARFIVP